MYFPLSTDGPDEKRLTFIALSLLLVSFLTQTSGGLIGPSSGLWLGCTRRLMRACRNTFVLLLPCADVCVACHLKREVRCSFSYLQTCMQITMSYIMVQSHLYLKGRSFRLFSTVSVSKPFDLIKKIHLVGLLNVKTVLHVVCGSLNPDSKVLFWRMVCNTLVNKLAQQF